MDRGKSQRLRLLDICQGIVNEQTFIGGSANSIEHDLKDLRVRLHMTDLTGDHEIIQQVKEIMFFPRTWKGLCGPVAKSVHPIASLFELFQYFHRAGE